MGYLHQVVKHIRLLFDRKHRRKKFENQLIQSNIRIALTYQMMLVTKLIVIVNQVRTLLVIHMSSI